MLVKHVSRKKSFLRNLN